ncbi:ComF family protein [Idiomarina zobellii]|uniref:Competence protein n=1 Tax=Idiomarina zobellii TaxID=86103 RepID=A0A837NG86_9GAMM|nr:phosphoribosyltransferase family protein [Idiomarina zobellii]KPD24350.1 competence protein [Idiomarina zobellii]SDF68161.1 comF family protein [Idiomarina zobellii]
MLAFLKDIANQFGRGKCWSCGTNRAGNSGFCSYCELALPRWYPACCQHLADLSHALTEQQCRYWFASLRWEPQTRQLMQLYKFQYRAELSSVFARILAAHITLCYQGKPLPDSIVAMPMTETSWHKRGFHQTALVAREVASLLNIRYVSNALRVVRKKPMQHLTSKRERWYNSHKSQLALGDFNGQSVAVIDDVITTGATVMAAADALYRKGAKYVDAWAVAYNQGD